MLMKNVYRYSDLKKHLASDSLTIFGQWRPSAYRSISVMAACVELFCNQLISSVYVCVPYIVGICACVCPACVPACARVCPRVPACAWVSLRVSACARVRARGSM